MSMAEDRGTQAALVGARAVRALGGRYSTELGIDVDHDEQEVERWALAATLFGARISAEIAQRTFTVLDGAGVHTIAQAGRCEITRLIELLDAGGYARYDLSTAERLHAIARCLEAHDDRVGSLLRLPAQEIASALRALPGWGPVTVALFLRELRGAYPQIEPQIDSRALSAAEHLGLLSQDNVDALTQLRIVASEAQLDLRDLETALVRLSLAHRHRDKRCPGGESCTLLKPEWWPSRVLTRPTHPDPSADRAATSL